MYPPGIQETIRNGGTGLVSAGNSLPLVVGYAKGGTVASPANRLFLFNDPNNCIDTLAGGPAVDLAAPIAARGGVMVLCTAATTAGTAGTVTPTRVGTSTGTITVAGIPWNNWKPRVLITGTGPLGTGKFKYALDGYSNTAAYSWSGEYLIPTGGTFVIPGTTLTATFVPGAGPAMFEAGDSHRFDCTAPHYTTTDLTAAFTYLNSAAAAAVLGTRRIRRVLMAGMSQTASAAVTLIAALSGHLDSLFLRHHNARAVIDGGSADTLAAFKTAIAAYTGDRITVCFGRASVVSESAISGADVLEVPIAHAVAERAAGSDFSENLGRALSGTLRGVKRVSHDERFELGFTEADRIVTLTSVDGEGGFFVTNGYIRSSLSSDFKYWDWGILVDEACETINDALIKWRLENLDAKTDGTGNLTDVDASLVEASVQMALNARIMQPLSKSGRKGYAVAARFAVDRKNDFFGTGTVQGTCNIMARRPAETFAIQIGLVRQLSA